MEEPAKDASVITSEVAATPYTTFGDSPMIQSTVLSDKSYKQIHELTADRAGHSIWIRGRVVTTRAVGKGCFLVLRQNIHTIQAVMFQGKNVPKEMVKYSTSIPSESVIDIFAEVTIADVPIQGTTVKSLELNVLEIHVVSRATDLPFLVEDAGRGEIDAAATGLPTVNQDNALNFRWIDTRTPANQAIFRIQSGVCQLFRQFLLDKDFIEIHTPKLIGGASEGI